MKGEPIGFGIGPPPSGNTDNDALRSMWRETGMLPGGAEVSESSDRNDGYEAGFYAGVTATDGDVEIPRWDQDRIVLENGWNTPDRCGKCGEVQPARADLAAARAKYIEVLGWLAERNTELTEARADAERAAELRKIIDVQERRAATLTLERNDARSAAVEARAALGRVEALIEDPDSQPWAYKTALPYLHPVALRAALGDRKGGTPGSEPPPT
jgi:hypothetical protein